MSFNTGLALFGFGVMLPLFLLGMYFLIRLAVNANHAPAEHSMSTFEARGYREKNPVQPILEWRPLCSTGYRDFEVRAAWEGVIGDTDFTIQSEYLGTKRRRSNGDRSRVSRLPILKQAVYVRVPGMDVPRLELSLFGKEAVRGNSPGEIVREWPLTPPASVIGRVVLHGKGWSPDSAKWLDWMEASGLLNEIVARYQTARASKIDCTIKLGVWGDVVYSEVKYNMGLPSIDFAIDQATLVASAFKYELYQRKA